MNLNYEIIKEFYANFIPVEYLEYPFITLVRGKMILFDRNAINEYLGRPLNLKEGETDSYSRRMQQGTWNIGRICQYILTLGRIIVKKCFRNPNEVQEIRYDH